MTTTPPLGPVACCPSCTTFTRPHRVAWDPGGCLARYECRCGHRWGKPWLLSEDEMANYDRSVT